MLARFAHYIESRLAAFFAWLGLHIARRPYHVIIACLVTAAVLASGLPSIKSEDDARALYTPSRNNRAEGEWERWQAMFEAVDPQWRLSQFIVYKEGGNVLTRETLEAVQALHNKVTSEIVVQYKDTPNAKFADVCASSSIPSFESTCLCTGLPDLIAASSIET
eukprot:CAMPEP_0206257078 /NCGR_PEP_ID=MMETSP0047_2-20121206/25131_1 /ASSEMBLY_ACC=CAM_ASM_000192 /TAXON_ID=195065 /ORGANISM="Chroomonas mesostigmatica_cf, Strain CCMP1168" /LENGTH=163 /DNA_ID=CAMNT_0053683605 /DNA_START=164 /DNA_END=651 /DNA_ORIENTATION=-